MFYLNLDLEELANLDEHLLPAAERAMQDAARDLTTQTQAFIVEQVQNQLHSSRDKYLENLQDPEQVGPDVWVLALTPGAFFIEEGLPGGHEMIDDLLDDGPRPWENKLKKKEQPQGISKGRTKTSRDGSRYRVIPFRNNKAPTANTPAGQSLTDVLKKEMTKRGLSYGKLDKDAQGQPKIGKLASFNILTKPVKLNDGPGQGRGPVGAVRQGPTGIPFLQGVSVYQHRVKDRLGRESVKKFIMTFRVVSTKMKGSGRWVHPGVQAHRFFDKAYEWALKEWEEKIGPQVIQRVIDSI